MRFFAETAGKAIGGKVTAVWDKNISRKQLIVTTSSFPPGVMNLLGNFLEDFASENEKLSLTFKIAQNLGREWEKNGDADLFKRMDRKGWIDTSGNLTGYRNAPPPAKGILGLVVLAGADRVLDASGLADFYCCNSESLWEETMGRSFKPWCRSRFDMAEVHYSDEDLAFFDQRLMDLFACGSADLFQLSSLLESLPLEKEGVQDGKDARSVLLCNLKDLGLPSFLGFLGGKTSKNKAFYPYIKTARSFFRYDGYMEMTKRKKALEVIDNFAGENGESLEDNVFFSEEERGSSFSTDLEFVKAIRGYVESEDDQARQGLLNSDFVAISDKVLKFKPSRTKKAPKETATKVNGSPVEAVLMALWLSLKDYKKASAASTFPDNIDFSGQVFKYHDVDGDSSSTAAESQEKARRYIERLLGGVDALVEDYLLLDCGEGNNCGVRSNLLADDLKFSAARNSEPSFSFQVTLSDDEESYQYDFIWRLPETNSFRIAQELLGWGLDSFKRERGMVDILPVYHLAYYEELLLAKDDDETRQVLLYALRDKCAGITDLLTPEWRSNGDPMLHHMERLAHSYSICLKKAAEDGLFSIYRKPSEQVTLGSQKTPWQDLRDCYREATEAFVSKSKDSPLGAMLMRSFLVVEPRDKEDKSWVAQRYERSGIVTVLHPSILEMLEDHVVYLFACFRYAVAQELKREGRDLFSLSKWQDYVDLGAIQMPLGGLIGDANEVVNTQVVGKELIHKVLPLRDDDGYGQASLSTRLLLRYEGFDEEELSDDEIFQESRESRLLETILNYYRDIHPHAQDGLSLAFYWNKETQPIIAAIHSFLGNCHKNSELKLNGQRRSPYSVSITIFTETGEDAGVSHRMEEWKERWETSKSDGKHEFYRYCRFSIAHRVIPGKNNGARADFAGIIEESLDVDLLFFYDFIDAGAKGNNFESIGEFDVRGCTLKFPIMEKSFCKVENPAERFQRVRVISNPQFVIPSQHLETMVRIKNKGIGDLQRHVLTGTGDFTPWKEVIDKAHRCAEWVVCIDPSVDDVLIRENGGKLSSSREIIGFGSGVGLHGELNYTISTEQCGLSDIRFLIKRAIQELYLNWSDDRAEIAAETIVSSGSNISGVSLIKATGIGTYIRDFMSYSLVQRIFEKNGEDVLCHAFISLDAYKHWFARDEKRPDLLLLTARMDGEEDKISLELSVIECKLAFFNLEHIKNASSQVSSGLSVLMPAFAPSSDGEVVGDDDRPDRRYWWLQLHRLLASKMRINTDQREKVMAALESLAAGKYSVRWNAAITVFWTDKDTDGVECEPQKLSLSDDKVTTLLVSVGKNVAYDLCSGKKFENPFSLKSGEDVKDPPAEKDEPKDLKEEEQSDSPSIPKDEIPVVVDVEDVGEEPVEEVEMVDETRSIPPRILLGKATPGNREVFWEFGHKELNNRHLLVFGSSGMGKTYAIQCLLCDMGKQGQNALVMDYTNGFTPAQLEDETVDILGPEQYVVRQKPLPISPFTPQVLEIGGGLVIPESTYNAAKRIADTFAQVYTSLGDQQYSHLVDAIEFLMNEKGDRATLEDLESVLESLSEDGSHDKNRCLSVLSKIKPFIRDKPFAPGAAGCDWNDLFGSSKHRCNVFQFAGMGKESSRLGIEFTLWDLYAFVRGRGNKNLPKVVVLDEAQNLDLTENSPVSKFLTEGRKFGISLILATQTMKNLQGDKLSRLFQAGHKLFFRPADTELQEHAKLLSQTTGDTVSFWLENLSSLKKGECYSLGPSHNTVTGEFVVKAFKIHITSLRERFFSHE